jgi:disulfide bond formation protein DsbB
MYMSLPALMRLERIVSIFGIIAVFVMLIGALVMQFVYHEAPCPLCELQRVGMMSIAIALFMNLKYGARVAHWALVILTASAGIAVSMRQILLHVNDPIGFGSAVLGLHMYTWCFIGFGFAIVGVALFLILCRADV